MLKLLYKSLVIGLISGSLLMLDFNYKTSTIEFNTVHAETLKTDKVGDTDLFSTITMAIVGVLASRLYAYKWTPDIWLAAAGGTIFVAGDILAYAKLKKVMKDMETSIKRNKKGEIDQKQIEVLEELRQMYVEARKTAETKKNLQLAAAAAFAAAGVTAFMMETKDTAALTACTTAVTTAVASLTKTMPSCASLTYASGICFGQHKLCMADIAIFQKSLMAHEMKRAVPGPSSAGLAVDMSSHKALLAEIATITASCVGFAMAGLAMTGPCTTLIGNEMLSDSGGTVPGLGQYHPLLRNILTPYDSLHSLMAKAKVQDPNWLVNSIDKISNLIMPKAHASLFNSMGIASSLAIKFILATYPALAMEIDFFMLIPRNRAKAWAVLAMLTAAATTSTSKQIGTIDQNISKIDAILATMYGYAKGVQTQKIIAKNTEINSTNSNAKAVTLNANENEEIDLKADGTSIPCGTGKEEKTCDTFGSKVNTADLSELSGLSQQQINSIFKTADGLSGQSKINTSTLNEAQELGKSRAVLNKKLADSQKKAQDALDKRGIKADLAKETDDLKSKLHSIVKKELEKNKMSAGDMLASFGGGYDLAKFSALPISDSNKETTVKATNVSAVPAFTVPKIDIPKMDLGKETLLEDKAAEEAALAAAAAANGAGGKATTMDDYALENDITKDKETSIFEVISNRYQKSGYPRLFKKLKN